jgi:hypothetical protein
MNFAGILFTRNYYGSNLQKLLSMGNHSETYSIANSKPKENIPI